MPQNGLHGLIGLATAKVFARRVPAPLGNAFAGAIVGGAMLPDIDAYPTAIAFLIKPGLTYVIHRSFTHSLLAILLVLVTGAVLQKRMPGIRTVCLGLALGMLTHDLLDMVFWFAQIRFLWPLEYLAPGHPEFILNVWQGWKPPTLVLNIREACEYLAFALLLLSLRRIAIRSGADPTVPIKIRRVEIACWAYFGVTLATAFLLSESWQNVVVTAPYLMFFLPFCWLSVLSLRAEIRRWSEPELVKN